MSTDLITQIERLEEACHATLRNGNDADTIALLIQTLNAVNFGMPAEERAFARGLAHMASVHADMLLHALNTSAPRSVVHDGLVRLCNTLAQFRESIEAQSEDEVSQRAG